MAQNTDLELEEYEDAQDETASDEPKYAIGVLAGLEYSPVPNAELTDLQKNALKERLKDAQKRDYPARLVEVIAAWEAPLALDTPIPTPSGWKTMGEMRVGDYVFGSDGRICNVTAVGEIQKKKSCRVTFDDESSIVASEDHSWSTQTLKERYAGKGAKLRTTKELAETVDKTHSVTLSEGLQTFNVDLLIDPYVLGCWLGDGLSANGYLCGNLKDLNEISDKIKDRGYRIGEPESDGGKNAVVKDCYRIWIHGLTKQLRALGILHNKRIPRSYLRASTEQRIALLQGLMDTDGWVTTNRGACGWGQCPDVRYGLIGDVSELLTSLGVKHNFNEYERERDGKTFRFQQSTFYPSFCAFQLTRKSAAQRTPKVDGRTKKVYVTSVEPVGERQVRCITVDSKDHLFLAGLGMVPTHNCLFYRGFQFLIPQRGGGWIIPGESTGYGPSMQMDLALLPTNIYSARGQMLIAALTRTVPNMRFAPQRADSDIGITAAESADKFVKVISRNNDLIMIQTDAARFLYTDGRFGYWSRFVKDGQKFGWEEDDEPDDLVPENEPVEDGQTPTEGVAAGATSESTETAQEADQAGESQINVDHVEQEAAVEDVSAGQADEDEETQEDETPVKRTPRGQEVRTAHGKLELKIVPMSANDIDEVDVLIYETEVSTPRAKGMFFWCADDIRQGTGQSPNGEIARLARQNVKLGMQSTYVTSDSVADDTTIQRAWMRPSWLMGITDVKTRDELIEMFPNGVLFVMAGETFCYARNESMDDSWALGQAYSGDGQNRNAMGTSTLPIQKRLNNWLDLMNDYFVRAVPKKWMDSRAFNVEAIRGQTNVPGDIGAFKRQPGTAVNELIFVEPAVPQPESLSEFIKEYSGPLAELLSGAYPALAGGDTGTADSGVAIATQRDSALGRLAPTWHSMKNAEAKSMKQLVRWGAKCRDGSINERIPGGQVIRLEVNDLKGNILCFAESDENFPETYTQRKNAFMTMFDAAAKNPQLAEVMFNAANLEYMQAMTSQRDVYIPQVLAHNKQLGEIQVMLAGRGPVPNPAVVEAQAKIQQMKGMGVDPAVLQQAEQEVAALPQEICSVPIDAKRDDNETEAATCWQFINGDEGRREKRTNRKAFEDICLHFDAHVEAAQAKAAQAQQPGKPPSLSANYKDVAVVDPGAAAQILQKGGVTPTAGAQAPAPVPAAAGAKAPALPIPHGAPEQPPTRVQ